MPKALSPKDFERQSRRHNPLEHDLAATGLLKNKPGKRKSRSENEEDKYVDSKQSRKILKIGQELTEEDQLETAAARPNPAFDFATRFGEDEEEQYEDDAEAWGDEEEEVEEVELDPEDRDTFSKFFPTQEDPLLEHGWDGPGEDVRSEGPGTDLAALILEKIAQHEATEARRKGEKVDIPGVPEDDFELHPKVVGVYSKYVKSGIEDSCTNNAVGLV